MRHKVLRLDQAMRYCVFNDQVTAVVVLPGGYGITWKATPGQPAPAVAIRPTAPAPIFATADEVRAAVTAACGDYYAAAEQLRAEYEKERK